METAPLEWVIVLATEQAGETLALLREKVRLRHILPPRLLLAEVPRGSELEGLQRMPGVVFAGAPPLPEALQAQLTSTERLFLRAWLSRQAPKERAGEGLPWDAPGFKPPDAT